MLQQSLESLLKKQKEIALVGQTDNLSELLKKTRQEKPDLILLALSGYVNFTSTIKTIPEMCKESLNTKILVLLNHDDKLPGVEALEQGACGVIEKDQDTQVFFRAIKQINNGEMYLRQKLIDKLINRSCSSSCGSSNGSRSGGQNRPEVADSMIIDSLTERERQVIAVIGLGMKNKEIAKNLFISEATVRHHLSSIYSKLMVDDRLNLIIYAYQHKLIPLAN